MLVDRGDDVPAMFGASRALAYIRAALDGDIVRFGGPRSENDFFGWASEDRRLVIAVSTPFSASQPYAWFRLLELP